MAALEFSTEDMPWVSATANAAHGEYRDLIPQKWSHLVRSLLLSTAILFLEIACFASVHDDSHIAHCEGNLGTLAVALERMASEQIRPERIATDPCTSILMLRKLRMASSAVAQLL